MGHIKSWSLLSTLDSVKQSKENAALLLTVKLEHITMKIKFREF